MGGVSSRSIHGQFKPLVPRVLGWLGGGKMWPVEGLRTRQRLCGVPEHHDATGTCHIIDAGGHIDYIHESLDGCLRGLSVRVQEWQPKWKVWPFNSFTLRTRGRRLVDVELEHLARTLTAPDEGLLRPAYHIHAYMRDGQVDAIGMVRTADLVRYVLAPPIGSPSAPPQPSGNGANNFVWVGWDDLTAAGITIRSWVRREMAA